MISHSATHIATIKSEEPVFQEGKAPSLYNVKMLLGHVQLVLPVSFQMLPGSGTFLFKTIISLELVHLYQSASHYQLRSTQCLANKTGHRWPSIQRCV